MPKENKDVTKISFQLSVALDTALEKFCKENEVTKVSVIKTGIRNQVIKKQ